MKNSAILFFLLCALSACAQNQPSRPAASNQQTEIFNAKYVRLVEDTIKMMLIDNVVIRFGDLYIEADSALLDKRKEMVSAYGIKKALFKGDSISTVGISRISYKKGEAQIRTE